MRLLTKPKYIVAAYCLGIPKYGMAKFAPTMKYGNDYVPEAEGIGRLKKNKEVLSDGKSLLSNKLRQDRLQNLNIKDPENYDPSALTPEQRRKLTRDTILRKNADRAQRLNLTAPADSNPSRAAYDYLVNQGPVGYNQNLTPRLARNPTQAANSQLLNLVKQYTNTVDPATKQALLMQIRAQEEQLSKMRDSYAVLRTNVDRDLGTRNVSKLVDGERVPVGTPALDKRLFDLNNVQTDLKRLGATAAPSTSPASASVLTTPIPASTAASPAPTPPTVPATPVPGVPAPAAAPEVVATPKKGKAERFVEAIKRGKAKADQSLAASTPALIDQSVSSTPAAVPAAAPQANQAYVPVAQQRETIKDIMPAPVKRGAKAVSNSVQDVGQGAVRAVGRINPLLMAGGLTALGAGGLLLGGNYLSNKRQQEALARQQELANVQNYQPPYGY